MALGSTPATHRRAAKAVRKVFFKHLKVAESAAKRGSCTKAVKALTEAAAWHGVAVAEHLDSGLKKSQGPTKKPMVAATKAVIKGCSCKRRK